MNIDQLASSLGSPDGATRFAALRWMRDNVDTLPDECMELASRALDDSNNDCRWQAFIVVGEFIPRLPFRVWDIICRYGISADEDMRDATATVLLEHLLEHDFPTFMNRLEAHINAGNIAMLDTLQRSWNRVAITHRQRPVGGFVVGRPRVGSINVRISFSLRAKTQAASLSKPGSASRVSEP